MAPLRLRVLGLVIMALALAACGTAQTVPPMTQTLPTTTTTVPSSTRSVPVVDLAATPVGWVSSLYSRAAKTRVSAI